MIRIACGDIFDPAHENPWAYVTRSFGFTRNDPNLLISPPADGIVVLLQSVDAVKGTVPLPDFIHPDDCTYWFGRSDGMLLSKDMERANMVVHIPAAATWELYSHQAAAIVLYDRFVKRNGLG